MTGQPLVAYGWSGEQESAAAGENYDTPHSDVVVATFEPSLDEKTDYRLAARPEDLAEEGYLALVAQLTEDIDKTKTELKNERNTKHLDDLEHMREARDELDQKLQAVQRDKDTAISQASQATADSMREAVQAKNAELLREQEKARSLHEAVGGAKAATVAVRTALEKEVKEVNQKLEESEARRAELQGKLDNFYAGERERTEMARENERLRIEVAKLEHKDSKLHTKAKGPGLEARITELTAQNSEVEKELAIAKVLLEAKDKTIADKQQLYEETKTARSQDYNELQTLRAQSGSKGYKAGTRAWLVTDRKLLQVEVDAAKLDIKKLQKIAREKDEDIERLKEEVRKAAEVQAARHAGEDVQRSATDGGDLLLREQLAKAEERIVALLAELEAGKSEASAAERFYKNALTGPEKTIVKLADERHQSDKHNWSNHRHRLEKQIESLGGVPNAPSEMNKSTRPDVPSTQPPPSTQNPRKRNSSALGIDSQSGKRRAEKKKNGSRKQ
ncbi:hypothetical protein Q5752_005110 [Cryptotrichosporon argae]